jgi:hypothetical protein
MIKYKAETDDRLQEFINATKRVSKILEGYFEDAGRVGVIMESI